MQIYFMQRHFTKERKARKMQKYIMALDQGTSISRCVIFNKEGNVVSKAEKELKPIYPIAGWVEHDPMELWSSQLGVIMEAMAKGGISAQQIAAIGISNQRETAIVWDKNTGEPVYNAIVWQCNRTAEMIEELRSDDLDKMIREKTGLVNSAYFSASKITWILDHVQGARAHAEKGDLLFGTVDSWLIWKLSGGKIHVTDYTNASRTMLFDIHNLCWDEELLKKFRVPAAMLPEVKASRCVYGYTDASVLGGEIPIAGAAGDQQAALFGQCCFEEGEVKNSYGTGCFMLMNIGRKPKLSQYGLVTTIAASYPNEIEYALEGSVFVAGGAVQWLRDGLRMLKTSDQSAEYAMRVEDTAGVYVVPAFNGLGAPYWDHNAKGTVVGLTTGCKKEHFIRATLESVAYQAADVLKAMEADSGFELKSLKVSGSAGANDFLMQFQSDILNIDIERPKCVETSALGAAYLAGLAVGYWKNKDEIRELWQCGQKFEPKLAEPRREKLLAGWKRAVKCARIYGEVE